MASAGREQERITLTEADRVLEKPPALPGHFVMKTNRNLHTHGLWAPTPESSRSQVGDELPSRRPSLRLAYETHHWFRRNQTARPRASDLIDLGPVAAVPYVDYFVTDCEMLDYYGTAARELGHDYDQGLGNIAVAI
jgi:hypothetical protein